MTGIDKDSVKILFNSSKVKVDFDSKPLSIEEIEKAIQDLGYSVINSKVKAA